MKVTLARLEAMIWVLIYGGLILASIGIALRRRGEAYGWGLMGVGGVGVLLGVLLVWLRSRLADRAP